jgi:RND family efflux transporter MFP subunit
MSEQEFELYLKLLSRCLSLTPGQREQIADELRDHLEERLAELAQSGIPREKAILQALDECGEAAVLAANFTAIARLKRRRILMRLSLGSVGVLTAGLLIAIAFWPENRAVRGPERVVAQEKPTPAAPPAQEAAEPKVTPSQRPSGKRGLGGLGGPATPPVVEVCRPVNKEVINYQTFAGNLEPSQRVRVQTRATGYLRKVGFRTGQVVKQGDPIFEIDPATYQVDVDKAKAEVARAQARLKLALVKAKPLKLLNQTGQGPPGAAEEAEQEAQIAQADLAIARANLEQAQLQLAWTRISAPITGSISRPAFDVGSLVKAEESVLATIVCLDPVYVSIRLDQSTWFALRKRVQRGEFRGSDIPVQIAVSQGGDLRRKGYLEFLEDATFDPGDRSAAMQVRVPNSDAAFVAGLFVLVSYEGNRHAAMLVPEKALVKSGANPCVWVVDDQNTLHLRGVGEPASTDVANFREIKQGLKADEWIVCDVHGPHLFDGKRIETKRVP